MLTLTLNIPFGCRYVCLNLNKVTKYEQIFVVSAHLAAVINQPFISLNFFENVRSLSIISVVFHHIMCISEIWLTDEFFCSELPESYCVFRYDRDGAVLYFLRVDPILFFSLRICYFLFLRSGTTLASVRKS